MNQRVAVEPRRGGIEFFGGELVGPKVLVGQLEHELEFDRHQIVSAHTTCAPRGHQRLHGVELRAAERRACIREHFGRALSWRLIAREGDRSTSEHNRQKLSGSAH